MTAEPAPSIPGSRLQLCAAFIVIVAMAVIALVPQQAAIVASMAVTEGMPLVAWVLAAYGIGSLLFKSRSSAATNDGENDSTLILVTRIALGLGALSLLTLLLGLTAVLRQPTAIAILAAGDLLAFRHIYQNRATILDWLRGHAGASWLLLLIAPVFALVLIGACVLPGLLWGLDDPSGYDVVAYHLQLPREWYDLGRVNTLRHNVFSFFPLNVEMHYLLAMHLRGGPWAGMYLAQMMHGTFVALTVSAVYATARSRGRLAASVAAVVCAGVPWMFMLGSVAYVEGGLMLFATLSAAWAIRGRWALAGACAGFACGCKLTGAPLAILIAASIGSLSLWERVRAVGSSNDKHRSQSPRLLPEGEGAIQCFDVVRGLVIFGVVGMLVFAPWLIRTAIASGGNPIFPLALRTLGHGHFDAGQIERFEAAHAPREDQQSIDRRLRALWQQVGGDYHYGSIRINERIALPLWLALLIPAILLARRDREAILWLLLVVGSVVLWLFATHLQGRFLVQTIPFVAMLIACGGRPLEGVCPQTPDGTDRASRRAETPSRVFVAVAVIVTVVSLIGSSRGPISTLLKLPLGITDTSQLRELLPNEELARAVYDSDRSIALLGDAKAFWYAIPSSRLHYRGVFDVGSTGFRDGWLGTDVPPDAAVGLDLIELTRFYRTYRKLPEGYSTWDTRALGPVIRVDDVPR